MLLAALALIATGMAVPLLAADTLDGLMRTRGWRPGDSRQAALSTWASRLFEPAPTLPVLRLDIRFKEHDKLVTKRIAALKSGLLQTSNDDFVPGQLRFDGQTLPLKVRLQGDDVDALRGDRWPLRVRIRGAGHVLGVERFTLRPPAIDGFYDKQLVYRILAKAGRLMAPRYRFVQVFINGKALGAMAMEEYLSDELVGDAGRIAGPIVRIDDATVLPDDATATMAPRTAAPLADLRGARGSVMRAGRWQRTPERQVAAKRALELLDGLLDGTLEPSAAVDVAASARMLAFTEALGIPELLRWDNLRWHYNVSLDRLEPIAYCADPIAPVAQLGVVNSSWIGRHLLADVRIAAVFADTRVRSFRAASNGDELHADYPIAASALPGFEARRKRVMHALKTAISRPAVELSDAVTRAFGPASVRRSETETTVVVRAGEWRLDEPLDLPAGIGLTLKKGAVVRIGARGGITVRGPLVVDGSATMPVTIELSAPSDGVRARGLLCAGCTAVMHHLRVVDAPHKGALGRPGLTLFGAKLVGADIDLDGGNGSSALELVGTRAELDGITIRGARGDGLKIVHGRGSRIVGLTVNGCLGDGVDVQGAVDTGFSRLSVQHIGDKAVSIGEAADVRIKALQVDSAAVGVAVKDGSRARIDGAVLKKIEHVGIASYAKSSRYGPAQAVVTDAQIQAGAAKLLSHADSTLTIDGRSIPPTKGTIGRLYEQGWLGRR